MLCLVAGGFFFFFLPIIVRMKCFINSLLLNTQGVCPLVSDEQFAYQAFPFCFGAKRD